MVLIGVVAASARVEAKGAPKSPPELIATFARGPASGLDGIRAFANAIQPGAGMAISDAMVDGALAQMAGIGSLDGLDATSPEYLLYLDDGAQKGLVLVAKISDQTKLQLSGASTIAVSNGWGAIGAPSFVKKVSAYALATLPGQPAPTMPSVTVDVPHALARYKSEIAMVQNMTAGLATKGDPMSKFMKIYADGLMGAAADTDRLVATIDADKTDVAIDFALVPKPGTRLAKFVGAQKTFDQALLAKLPPASPAMLFAGHLESGPYRKAMVDLLTSMYGAGGGKEIAQITDAVMAASTGDVAMTMDMVAGKGMSGAYLYGVADEKAVTKQLDKVHDLLAKGRTFTMMGMKMTMVANTDPADHDGVAVRGYDITYDLSTMPADQRAQMQAVMAGNLTTRYEMASFDTLGLFAFGNDAVAVAGHAIDAARGKGNHWKPVGEVASALTASKARNDSLVMLMDFGAFASFMPQTGAKKPTGQMVMTIGFADGSAHFRMQMSAATIKSMKP
jgi:hypothetical protein